jgi:hypothetical protein
MKRFTIIAQDENLEIILVKRAHTLDALLSAINSEEKPIRPDQSIIFMDHYYEVIMRLDFQNFKGIVSEVVGKMNEAFLRLQETKD